MIIAEEPGHMARREWYYIIMIKGQIEPQGMKNGQTYLMTIAVEPGHMARRE